MAKIALNDIPAIAKSLKCGSSKSVKLLNEIVSDHPFDRSTRKNLRQFTSFPDDFDVIERKQKLLEKLNLADFISVCNLLYIDCTGSPEVLCDRIFDSLSDLNSFQSTIEIFSSDDDTNESKTISNIEPSILSDHVTSDAVKPKPFASNPSLGETIATGSLEAINRVTQHSCSTVELRDKTKTNYESASVQHISPGSNFDPNSIWFILREICELARSFSGKDAYSVHNFISDLEEIFSTYCFTADVHKILITKKLLLDPARIFVLSLKNVTYFENLKEHLITEFGTKISSIDVHKLLHSRKLRQNETVTEYLIAMRALASQSNIDDESLIEYCIEGLPNSQAKLVLYGCTDLFEFKQKLRSFEKLYSKEVKPETNFHRSFKPNNQLNRNFPRDYRKTFTEEKPIENKFTEPKFHTSIGTNAFRFPKVTEKLCFNCGERNNHESRLCPHRDKGMKCFACKKFGSHKAANCPSKRVQANVTIVHPQNFPSLFTKTVTVNSVPISAVIDTASNKTLLKEEFFRQIAPNCFLDESTVQLHGLGNNTVTPLGSFSASIFIDDFEFYTDICVVPNTALQFPMLVGADVLSQGDLKISHGVVSLTKTNTLIVTSSSTHNFDQDCSTPRTDDHKHSTMSTNENVIANCVECILCNKKRGKKEGLLHSIPKGDIPLSTYHIDFLGPLPTTNKQYQYIFSVVDAFTKFTWLYPVKSTTSRAAIEKLQLQSITFGNPSRIISDRGSAFQSTDFAEYCKNENIDHAVITTGIPRGNGQVERIHGILIPVLAKLSIDDPSKWFKFVPDVQRILNSTNSATTNFTPFELMIGIKMKNKDDLRIKQLLDEENLNIIMQDKHNLRETAKRNILDHQTRSQISYNKRRKKPTTYKQGDIVAIQRTQFSPGSKLYPKFYGPYKVTRVKSNDRYDVQKLGQHAGPNTTATAADHMKPWTDLSSLFPT